MLRTAAVAGRAFDLLVVERASGADAEVVDAAMESALVLGLVEAEDVGRYRFTHALVRDALYAMVPPPTRARAHAAVATALEDRYAGTVGAHVAELAEHYARILGQHADRQVSDITRTCLRRLPSRLPIHGGTRAPALG